MAKTNKPSVPARILPPSIPPDKGIELIKRQVEAGEKLKSESYVGANPYDAWKNTTENYLSKAFGEGSTNVTGFQALGRVVMAPLNAGDAWWEQRRRNGLEAKLVRLKSYIDILATELDLQEPPMEDGGSVTPSSCSLSRKVFLVHGHNETVRETCARLLERLDLQPIILHEQPNSGRTIIEKFHDYSDVGFAIVLLTGDDKGTTKDADVTTLKRRSRQNVILELGFFLAKLGRSRVCAIYEAGVELPSDYEGVLYIELDSRGAWRFQLCRELKAVGIDVDLNKAL